MSRISPYKLKNITCKTAKNQELKLSTIEGFGPLEIDIAEGSVQPARDSAYWRLNLLEVRPAGDLGCHLLKIRAENSVCWAC